MSYINFPRLLLCAMNDGVDLTSGKRFVKGHGTFLEWESFDELMAAWDASLREMCRWSVVVENAIDKASERDVPDVLCSALTDDCIARGKTIKEGGAVYDLISGLQVGISNMADSLAAIKKLVYEEGAITRQQLWDALLSDFAGEGGLLSGTSPWKDKLGEKVADERITISLAPLDQRIVCGNRTTGEGFRAEDFDIIRNGRLNAFYLGLYASNKLKLPRGKNDSFNVIVAPGDKPIADIIASVDKGILVGRFSGGQPASNGDFSGVAKNSFLIENGKIGPALSETMIAGNMADMLNRLRDISAEQVVDGMMVLPYMAFDGITISGK
jgi:hypothetical protein